MTHNQTSFDALKHQMITATDTLYHSNFDAARDYLRIIAGAPTIDSKEALFRTAISFHATQAPKAHKRKTRQTRRQKMEQELAEKRLFEVVEAWGTAAIMTNAPLADTARELWKSVSLQGKDAVFAFGILLGSNVVPYVQIPMEILEHIKPEDVYVGASCNIRDAVALFLRIQGISHQLSNRQLALATSKIIKTINDEVDLCAFMDFLFKNTSYFNDSISCEP